MTDSDERPEACAAWLAAHEEWAPVPGFAKSFEASHRGNGVRSIDRVVGNRRLRGVNRKAGLDDDGYPVLNMRGDDGELYRKAVHWCVLMAHAGAPEPGQECLHRGDGKRDHRYCGCGDPDCPSGAVRWGSRAENIADLAALGLGPNGRPFPAPKPPPAPCIRCGAAVTKGGRRCHDCVVAIGVEAADLLRAGVKLEDANERLEYANAVYLHNLAVKYGGWGQCQNCSRAVTDPPSATRRDRLARALGLALGHRS